MLFLPNPNTLLKTCKSVDTFTLRNKFKVVFSPIILIQTIQKHPFLQ